MPRNDRGSDSRLRKTYYKLSLLNLIPKTQVSEIFPGVDYFGHYSDLNPHDNREFIGKHSGLVYTPSILSRMGDRGMAIA